MAKTFKLCEDLFFELAVSKIIHTRMIVTDKAACSCRMTYAEIVSVLLVGLNAYFGKSNCSRSYSSVKSARFVM